MKITATINSIAMWLFIWWKNEHNGVLSKLYVLNLENSSWTMPTVVENGQDPGPLYGHAAAIYKDSMLIYGGCCFHGEAREDLYALDLNFHLEKAFI